MRLGPVEFFLSVNNDEQSRAIELKRCRFARRGQHRYESPSICLTFRACLAGPQDAFALTKHAEIDGPLQRDEITQISKAREIVVKAVPPPTRKACAVSLPARKMVPWPIELML